MMTLMGSGPSDLREKAVSLSGLLFEMIGVANGRAKAEDMLDSGKAECKLREIIGAQGGKPTIKSDELAVGAEKAEVRSEHAGKVIWLSTEDIVRIAREAGAPKEKGAGIVLHAKLGETVHKDAVLFDVYAERSSKLTSALELANQLSPIALTKKPAEKMILDQVPEKFAHEKAFSLDR
jgi:AMP phosphorylase